ncbi:MAG: hypothetical protein K0V04_14860 [Deltaproteobacteria bacterium]|nr:hypothetical protein [Deltaproteobacteria bacterium]
MRGEWQRLSHGGAVLVFEGRPVQVIDLGLATLDIGQGVFAGDDRFGYAIEGDLLGRGWDVLLGRWSPASDVLRLGIARQLDDHTIAYRALSVADVVGVVVQPKPALIAGRSPA